MNRGVFAQKSDTQLMEKVDSISKILTDVYNEKDWKKIGDKEFEVAKFFKDKGLFTPAIEHYLASEKAFAKVNDHEAILDVYTAVGKLYNYSYYGENSKALSYFLKAYQLADSLGRDDVAYVMLGNIGSIYSLENHHDEGLRYLFMAIDRLKKLDLKQNIGVFYGNIANVYILKNDYDSAYYYYNISIQNCIAEHDTMALARNYVNLANLSIRDQKYDKAIDYLNKGLEIYIPKNNSFGIAISYKLLAKAYLLKSDFEKAERYAIQSLEIGRKIKSSNRVMSAYKMLWKINEKKQNYKEALKYLSLYKTVSDSVKQQKENDEITHLLSDFESQQNLHEIKLLKIENALSESQLKNKNSQLFFIIIISIILLISASIFVWLFLKKKKAYLEILRKNIELEKREHQEDIERASRSKLNEDVDMELIDAWKERIVETSFFRNSDCSVDLCAQELSTNRSYLSRAINQFYEQNFNSVINELRIKDARKLLRQKEAKKYTIEFIAQEVGFNNKVSFTTSFKKITGLTPAFYRDHAPAMGESSI